MANPTYGSPNFSTTLNVGGGINNSQTTGIILQSVSGLNTNGGILGFDWASTIDTAVYEELEYTGISGNELTGVTRGVNGFTARSHNNLAVVVNVVSSIHNNRIADKLTSRDAVLAQDPNGNEIIKTAYNASAVNEVTVTNAATANAPTVTATGGDTDIDISVTGKGAGKVKLGSGGLKFPNSDGSNGQVLQTNGSGVLSFGAGSTDGWTAVTDSWAYASASTITVPTGAAAKYDVGDKIKITQTTVKYLYITAVADTVLTVNAGTDYTVANAAITSPYYSKASSPNAFPQWFSFTSANRDWDSTDPTTVSVSNEKFTIHGRACTAIGRITYTNAGTTNTQFQCDMPVAANQTSSKYHTMALASMSPNQDDSFLSTAGQAQAILFSTTGTLVAKLTTGSMSAKAVWYNVTYQI